jgi:hypothetical protein
VKWIQVAQDGVKWWAAVNMALKLQFRQLLKKAPASSRDDNDK